MIDHRYAEEIVPEFGQPLSLNEEEKNQHGAGRIYTQYDYELSLLQDSTKAPDSC